MPTARELLEQADALMRRNRARSAPPQPLVADFPVLTEKVDASAAAANAAAHPIPPAPGAEVMPDGTQRAALRATPVALDDVPLLTDAVEEIDATTLVDEPDAQGEISRWLEIDRGEASITGPLPDSVVVVPPPDVEPYTTAPATPVEVVEETQTIEVTAPEESPPEQSAPEPPLEEEEIEPIALDEIEAPVAPPDEIEAEPLSAAALASAREMPPVEPAVPATIADEELRWDALAEEIRMQVLQRIDIFTDTGLREQLTARLQPIVDRASADLVATINQHVGQLLRTYVAEAIEREIEKWRQGGG